LTGGLFLAALDQNAPQRLDAALPTIRPGDHARVLRRRRRWRAATLGTLAMAATVGLSLQRRRPS